MSNPAIIFSSERLDYRLFQDNDTDDMMTFWGDPEVMKFCGGVSNPTRERFLKTIEFYKNLYHQSGYSVFAVIEKSSSKVIGAAGFNPTDDTKEIELIYHFSKDSWGKGYATESAEACVTFAKSLKNISLISASFDLEHMASKKVLEKVGFKDKGQKWFEDTEQYEALFEYTLS